MKKYPCLLLLVAASFLPTGGTMALGSGGNSSPVSAMDSVEVTSRSMLRAGTRAGSDLPDPIRLSVNVRYELLSADSANVSLAINDKGAMDFTTVEATTVGRGQGSVDLGAELRLFNEDTLRCMVTLTKPGAAPTEKPLAVTYVSVNLKDLQTVRRHK